MFIVRFEVVLSKDWDYCFFLVRKTFLWRLFSAFLAISDVEMDPKCEWTLCDAN